MDEYPTFVSHLECSATGERYAADESHGLSKAGKPLLVRYDLEGIKRAVTRETFIARAGGFWKYREFLPVRKNADVVSLGEVLTPIIELPELARRAGAARLLVKDEGRLPTGSFKARGLALAVAMAKAFGVRSMAMPTNGNAGAALAAYATRAGIETHVFCPADTPEVNVREIALAGAHVTLVDGLINDCGRRVAEGRERMGWFDVSTLKEPYRLEGKKTMGFELAEQLDWQLPDAIFYPTGGGTGLIGMWKAFAELEAAGLDRPEAAADGRGAGGRLRADRTSLAAGRGSRGILERRPHGRGRHPRTRGDRGFPDPAGGPRERRLRNCGCGCRDPAGPGGGLEDRGDPALPRGCRNLRRLAGSARRWSGRAP